MNDQHDESKMSDALPSITGVIHVPGALRTILAMCLGLGGGIGVFNLIGLIFEILAIWRSVGWALFMLL
ncbi:hypothetical protein NB521_10745 [Vibrio alginolyticus]|nr:hypothetical protein [Vibrio alginolyticus]